MRRRNKLLILALGITFLVVVTFLASMVDSLVPHRPTAAVQTAQVDHYQVTLQVSPNPPPITGSASLILQIARTDTRQLVTHAQVKLASSMVSMDMGTDEEVAQLQSNGSYLAHVQFGMAGTWQVQVAIIQPHVPTSTVSFEITAQ